MHPKSSKPRCFHLLVPPNVGNMFHLTPNKRIVKSCKENCKISKTDMSFLTYQVDKTEIHDNTSCGCSCANGYSHILPPRMPLVRPFQRDLAISKKNHVHFLNDPAISPVRICLQDTIPRMQKVHVHKVIHEQLLVIATYLRQHRYTYIGESSVRSHSKE